ncbi:MAG: tetratricopeptide repeat protein [Vicinamibacterales bacterium]
MKTESIAFALAGMLFGLIAGWVIGSQQATPAVPPRNTAQQSAPASQGQPPAVDEAQASTLRSAAEREPANPTPRVQLGNLYFDAGQYAEAITWYTDALKLAPEDVNVSTDLGVSYYYSDQPDRALEQFARSLEIDPNHTKTFLNLGIVRAFGKQDLEGAEEAWTRVIELAPDSTEGQAAQRALESLRTAHPPGGAGSPGA